MTKFKVGSPIFLSFHYIFLFSENCDLNLVAIKCTHSIKNHLLEPKLINICFVYYY